LQKHREDKGAVSSDMLASEHDGNYERARDGLIATI